MKILIATGIYPPDIGGPAKYAFNLRGAFEELGHTVQVCSYRGERKLPFGLRQCVYLCRLIPRVFSADVVLVLDTVSTGFPAVVCARLMRKKSVVRVGGDFVWETYSERTDGVCSLPDFYSNRPPLTLKEKLLTHIQTYVVQHVDNVVFNSEWLRGIWTASYHLPQTKTLVIENYCLRETSPPVSHEKIFISAGRSIKLKNSERFRKAFFEAQKEDPTLILDDRPSSPREFSERLARAWAVAVPSVSEVSPNVIFEAVSLGKPFIVTKYNGLPERFKSIGLTVDPYSVADMKEKILTLARPDVHEQCIQVVSGSVCNQSWRSMAQQFIVLFQI